jgi:hypothetical protein
VPIRFYVDADLIGLGKLLVQVRPDVTYAGDPGGAGIDKRLRPPSPVQPGVYDHVWIPRIAQEVANGSRHVRIQGPPAKEKRKLRKWDQLEILVRQWDAIERLLDKPGPWIYSATRTRLRQEL